MPINDHELFLIDDKLQRPETYTGILRYDINTQKVTKMAPFPDNMRLPHNQDIQLMQIKCIHYAKAKGLIYLVIGPRHYGVHRLSDQLLTFHIHSKQFDKFTIDIGTTASGESVDVGRSIFCNNDNLYSFADYGIFLNCTVFDQKT